VTVDWALVSGLVERSYQASRELDGRAEGQAIRPRRARKTTRKKRAARKRSPGTRA
jgi:hypothetical protein